MGRTLERRLKWDIIEEKQGQKQALLVHRGGLVTIPPPSIIAGYTKDYQKRKKLIMSRIQFHQFFR